MVFLDEGPCAVRYPRDLYPVCLEWRGVSVIGVSSGVLRYVSITVFVGVVIGIHIV